MGNKNECITYNQYSERTNRDSNSKKSDNYSFSSKIYNSIKTDESNHILPYTSFQEKEKNPKNKKKKNKKINIQKVIMIQKYIRKGLALKKFYDRVELLRTILELDFSVNVIKDKKTEKKLLMNNPGEVFSQQLLSQKKIKNYTLTKYYKENINKYKPNKFLIKSPLTYIDKYKNQNLYIGTWTLEKNFHGYGIFYILGNKYEGFWNFGKLTGECRYFLQNKDYFIGNFKNGLANGYGKYFHNDGAIYEGNWENDQPSGKGKEIFIDNSYFEGIFEKGLKKKGIFNWNDGSYYEGEIFNNLFDGKGKFHWKDGREYIGNWNLGKMNGNGILTYIDDSKYEGNFVNGKKEGYGIYYWNKNKFYKGNWVKGKQNGIGYLFDNGKEINGIWKEGILISNFNSEDKLNKTDNNILSNVKIFSIINKNYNENKKYRSKNDSKSNNRTYCQKNNKNEFVGSLNLSINQSNTSFLEKYHMNKRIKNRNTKLNKNNFSNSNYEHPKSERNKLTNRQKTATSKFKSERMIDISNISFTSKISTGELFCGITPTVKSKGKIKLGGKCMFMSNYTIRKFSKNKKNVDI